MTDTPDKPTPPPESTPESNPPQGEADRADALIDAVVSDPAPPPTPEAPPSAQPASAGVKKKKSKPEPTTRWGKLWHGWIKPIGTVFIIVALLRSTIIDWNDVPTGSMEPTILVGDRILVNKMAYALQVPLSGPKIGVPFTPLQWDNPLDPLPSWDWGTPKRGDIVTFWNPVTGVRMVKRIVAEPGDTLELRGGVMTITPKDGTPTAATYVDLPPGRTVIGKTALGGDSYAGTEMREETLLGETRTIQHIPGRWTEDWAMYRFADGQEIVAEGGKVNGQTPVGAVFNELGQPTMRFAIRDGAPFVNDEEVSYNQFASAYLEPLASQGPVKFGDGHTVWVEGHTWQIDGEPAGSEQVRQLLADLEYLPTRHGQTLATPNEQQHGVMVRYDLLKSLLFTSFGPVTVGEDEYYMIGDNRNNSTDSRYFGPVQRSEITGEAVAIPASFNGRIRDLSPRWSRWFHGLD